MVSAITEGVYVSVQSRFQADHSVLGHFVFTYRISIENRTDMPVQLMRRLWFIRESDGSSKEIEGEGVVGRQPIINPGESHEYASGCFLATEFGKMYGSFLMHRLADDSEFRARIPQFQMIVPFKLN